jgi:hypothetical protein
MALAVVGAAACSQRDDGTDRAGDMTDDVTTTTRNESASTVEVRLIDFEFLGLPERVVAGTKIEIVNTAPNEAHELVAFRLPDGEERTARNLIALPADERTALLGGPPAMVLLATPDGPQITTLGDGTLSEPGRYLLFCAVPTGADAAEYVEIAQTSAGPPQVPGGAPHFEHGMYADLIVE